MTNGLANLLTAAQTNTLAAIQQQCVNFNAALKAEYLGRFADFATNVTTGQLKDNSNPPQPPVSYVVAYFNDPNTGQGGAGAYPNTVLQWPYPSQAGGFVCDMPPVPPIPGTATHAAGVSLIMSENQWVPNYFGMGIGDTTPAGTVVTGTSQDGKSGRFVCARDPFGGYYVKVA